MLEARREVVRKRVYAGLARARARGKRLGRPQVSKDVERAIREAHRVGKGQIKIAREVGCGVSTVRPVIGAEEAGL